MTRQAKPESLSPEEARLVKLELQEFEERDWYPWWEFYCLDVREVESRFSSKAWPPETELTRRMDTDSFDGELRDIYFQFDGLIRERYRKTFKIVSDVGRRNPCWGEPKFTRKVVWRYLRRIKPDIEKAFCGWFGGKFPFTFSIESSVNDVNSELRKTELRWRRKKSRTHTQKVVSQPVSTDPARGLQSPALPASTGEATGSLANIAVGHQALPSETSKRAQTVAKLIEELNILKPKMYDDSDYEQLETKHPGFLVFRIGKKHDLQERIVYERFARRNIRLAQDLAARFHGVTLSTIQTDWKKNKPSEFRQQSRKGRKRG